MIIDAQIHAYEANTPKRPWYKARNWPPHATGDETVAELDRLGIDGAIFVSANSLYQYDASYAVEVQRAHPGRFGIVCPINPDDPAMEEIIAEWKKTPGAVGIRLFMRKDSGRDPDDPKLDRMMRAAARHNLPVNLNVRNNIDAGAKLVDRHPKTRFVLDHLGMNQPDEPSGRVAEPWAELPQVLALAKRPNMVIKITGACTLSLKPYPFPDIWDPLARVFDAWGIERCLWGTDWTRAHALVSYDDAVECFRVTDRLNAGERAMLMGEACARVYRWKPKKD